MSPGEKGKYPKWGLEHRGRRAKCQSGTLKPVQKMHRLAEITNAGCQNSDKAIEKVKWQQLPLENRCRSKYPKWGLENRCRKSKYHFDTLVKITISPKMGLLKGSAKVRR